MSIRFHSSVIITSNVASLAAFYRDVMEQEIEFDFGACVVFRCGLSIWAPATEHAVASHIQSCANGSGRFELCFETDHFDSVIEKLRRHRVSFLHDVQKENWGQLSARFFDPENNLLEIGESIPCFVRRLHDSGMTIEAVAAQTSVPLAEVARLCADLP